MSSNEVERHVLCGEEGSSGATAALRRELEIERARLAAFYALIVAAGEKHRRMRRLAHSIAAALDEYDIAALERLSRHPDEREYRTAFRWAVSRCLDNYLLWCQTAFGIGRGQTIEALRVHVTPKELEEAKQRAPRDSRWLKRYRRHRAIEAASIEELAKRLPMPHLNHGRAATLGKPPDDDRADRDWQLSPWRPLDAVWDPTLGHSGSWRPLDPADSNAPSERGFPGISSKRYARGTHGTYADYKSGCRCTRCKAANAAYVRAARVNHGRTREPAPSSQPASAAALKAVEDVLGFTIEQMRSVYAGRAGGPLPIELRPLREQLDARLFELFGDNGSSIAQLAAAAGLPDYTLRRAIRRARVA